MRCCSPEKVRCSPALPCSRATGPHLRAARSAAPPISFTALRGLAPPCRDGKAGSTIEPEGRICERSTPVATAGQHLSWPYYQAPSAEWKSGPGDYSRRCTKSRRVPRSMLRSAIATIPGSSVQRMPGHQFVRQHHAILPAPGVTGLPACSHNACNKSRSAPGLASSIGNTSSSACRHHYVWLLPRPAFDQLTDHGVVLEPGLHRPIIRRSTHPLRCSDAAIAP